MRLHRKLGVTDSIFLARKRSVLARRRCYLSILFAQIGVGSRPFIAGFLGQTRQLTRHPNLFWFGSGQRQVLQSCTVSVRNGKSPCTAPIADVLHMNFGDTDDLDEDDELEEQDSE